MGKLEASDEKNSRTYRKKLNGINHPSKSQMYGHDQNELFIKHTEFERDI